MIPSIFFNATVRPGVGDEVHLYPLTKESIDELVEVDGRFCRQAKAGGHWGMLNTTLARNTMGDERVRHYIERCRIKEEGKKRA
jgi:hypothetical protein